MNHKLHPLLDLAVLPLLNIYHWLIGDGWTPLIDLFFPDRTTPEQRAKAKRRLAIHKLVEDAWAGRLLGGHFQRHAERNPPGH